MSLKTWFSLTNGVLPIADKTPSLAVSIALRTCIVLSPICIRGGCRNPWLALCTQADTSIRSSQYKLRTTAVDTRLQGVSLRVWFGECGIVRRHSPGGGDGVEFHADSLGQAHLDASAGS